MIVDVVVDRASGQVKVEQVTAAVDAGQIINPDGLTNQIEGGIIQFVSWTLKEAVKFDRERITTRDWSSYPILTFSKCRQWTWFCSTVPNNARSGRAKHHRDRRRPRSPMRSSTRRGRGCATSPSRQNV
jgi:CO/xanthine dehydrogenase Mo-binding subunit